MFKKNKPLTLIFIIALFIIIGELGYLALFNKPFSLLNSLKPAPSPTPVKKTTQGWNDPKNIDWFYKGINKNHAIDGKVLYSLIYYNKGVLTSSLITNTHKGKITSLDTKGGKAFFDYYQYKLFFRLANEKDPLIWNSFYLSQQDLTKTTLVEKSARGQEKTIVISDLKLGDTITVEETVDALKAEPIPSAKFGEYMTNSWGQNRVKVKIIRTKN